MPNNNTLPIENQDDMTADEAMASLASVTRMNEMFIPQTPVEAPMEAQNAPVSEEQPIVEPDVEKEEKLEEEDEFKESEELEKVKTQITELKEEVADALKEDDDNDIKEEIKSGIQEGLDELKKTITDTSKK